MSQKVFISGSISIKNLPAEVCRSMDRIMDQGMRILVGDARGVDSLVQQYCLSRGYFDVTIYTISDPPRNIASERFGVRKIDVPDSLKNRRNRQAFKDRAMTEASDFSLVVWDGKSKGSYANIARALEQGKKVKVYLVPEERFLEPGELTGILDGAKH
ncbi:MAG: hypothetical protein DSY91_03820 [Deltaproteobacteria bacterium]|nr:MAG: hypothetical protein DSY91_03820 [Deltaproteobacteria bacterium]